MAEELLPQNSIFGLLLQPKTSGVATALKCAGSYTNQWQNVATYNANFYTCNIESWSYDPQIKVGQLKQTSSASIYPDSDRTYISASAGSIPSVNFRGFAVKNNLSAFLASAFQNVIESGTTPYGKTYTMKSDVIDFNANPSTEGYLFTVAGRMYDNVGYNGDGFVLQNAMLDNFILSFDNTAVGDARLARIAGTFKGSRMDIGQTLAGTWSSQLLTGFVMDDGANDHFKLDISINKVDISNCCWKKFDLIVENNVWSNCFGQYGYPSNLLRREPKIKIRVVIPWNASTSKYVNAYQLGYAVDIDFYNQYSSADGYLDINAEQCRLIKQPTNEINVNSQEAELTLEAEVELKSAGTSGITVTHVDTLDWTF